MTLDEMKLKVDILRQVADAAEVAECHIQSELGARILQGLADIVENLVQSPKTTVVSAAAAAQPDVIKEREQAQVVVTEAAVQESRANKAKAARAAAKTAKPEDTTQAVKASAESAPAAPTQPTAPAAQPEREYQYDRDVLPLMVKAVKDKTVLPEVKSLLAKNGVTTAKLLTVEQYPEFIRNLKALLGED